MMSSAFRSKNVPVRNGRAIESACAVPAAIHWWSSGAIVPDLVLLYWLVAWQLVIATMNPVGALLVAHERYWLQTVTSMGAGILGAAAGYAIAPQFGPAGVVAAATISYLLVVVVPTGPCGFNCGQKGAHRRTVAFQALLGELKQESFRQQ